MTDGNERSSLGRLGSIQIVLMHVQILGIVAVLGGALYYQFLEDEFPCPLCLLQRMAMILAAMGPMFILTGREGRTPRTSTRSRFMRGYGMSIVAGLLGVAIASRQVLLHILPGDQGYGSAVLGWHLYTWAVVVFAVVILVSGVTLFFADLLIPSDIAPNRSRATRTTGIVFGLVIAVNVFATLSESGLRWFVDDNPTEYRLVDEIDSEIDDSK